MPISAQRQNCKIPNIPKNNNKYNHNKRSFATMVFNNDLDDI